MAATLASELRGAIVTFLSPLSAASTPEGAARLLESIGRVGAVAGDADLRSELQRVAGLVAGLQAIGEDDLRTWDGLARVLDLARELARAVRGVEAVLSDPELGAQAAGLGADLAERLVALYARGSHPRLFRAAALLGLVTPGEHAEPEEMVVGPQGELQRLPWARDALHPERLSSVLTDPGAALSERYLPGGMAQAADAHAGAAALFPLVADLARGAGLRVVADLERAQPAPLPPATEGTDPLGPWPPPLDTEPVPGLGPLDLTDFHRAHRPRLAIELTPAGGDPAAPARMGLALVASSGEHAGGARGYVLELVGAAGWSEERGRWRVGLSAAGSMPAVSLGAGGLTLGPGEVPGAEAGASLSLERIAAAGEAAVTVGGADGSRLEIGTLRLGASLTLSPTRQALEASADAGSAALVLAGGGDGFLGALLPADGLRVPFGLGLVLSSDRGLELRGGQALQLPIPAVLSAGPVTVQAIRIGLTPAEGAVHLDAAAAMSAELGPITAIVDGLGLRLTARPAPGGGALGPVDLEAGVRPPSGVGLTVDAGVVSGGGFLYADPARHEYAGALELELDLPASGKIAVKAIGVLTTELPGAEDDWALLLLVFAQFRWELGWGFTLNGLGGVVGLHHRPDPLALAEGMRGGVIDDLLFPEDPVADAPRIVPRLRAVFPIEQDTFTVGPALELGWGTPTLVHLRIGLLFEIDRALGGAEPSAVSKVVVLGQLLVQVPPRETGAPPIVRLLIDVVGWYDYDEEWLFFRARLRDSRIAGFPLTGELVVSVESGADPTLIVAAGGFHPSFADVPRGVPATMDRLGFGLALGRLTLEMRMYYAVTPNARHLGIDIDLKARLGPVSIEGNLGFDALADQETDRFVADVRFRVALRFKGRALCGVKVDMTLTGPGEWHAVGHGSFEILWWDVDFDFDERWGEEPALPATTVGLREELARAASSPANWSARLPPGLSPPITVEIPATGLVAHPLGELTFLQGIAPLGIEVRRVGAKRVAGGPVTFTASAPTLNGAPVASTPVREHFARGQFVDIDEEQALTSRAFERLDAGLTIGGSGFRAPAGEGGLGRAPLTFEDRYLVPEDEPLPDPDPALRRWRVISLGTAAGLSLAAAGAQARSGGAGRSARRLAAALAGDDGRRATVREPPLAVVGVEALAPIEGAAPATVTAGEQLAASRPGALLVEAWEAAG